MDTERNLDQVRIKDAVIEAICADIPMRFNLDGFVMVNLKNNGHLPFDFTVDIDQISDLVIRSLQGLL